MSATDYQAYQKRFLSDTFLPHHYSVVIATPGVLSAPQDGFIDDLNVEGYAVSSTDPTANPRATGTFPSSLVLSRAKERANMRWKEILIQCSSVIQPDIQFNVTALADPTTPADQDTEATLFEFVLKYDRPEYLRTEDELNSGVFLTGADAVTRFIARALSSTIVSNRLVYNPSTVNGNIQGPIIEQVTAQKLYANVTAATSDITVTLISEVSDTAL